MSVNVLLVEDNPGDAHLIRVALEGVGGDEIILEKAERLSQALERLSRGGIDAVLLDLWLPDSQGLDTFAKLHSHAPEAVVVILTGLADKELAVRAVRAGAQDYLAKGEVNHDLLVRALRYSLERNRLQIELKENQRRQLETKDQFLSHVSHELRSPLTAIYQFTTIVRDGIAGATSPEQREYLEIALKNARQLQNMIEDLLFLTRTGAGKLALDLRGNSVAELIDEAVSAHRPAAGARRLTFRQEVPADLPFVHVDRGRILQVLTNLLDNAIRYSPEGATIAVRAEASKEEPGFVRVAVADHGQGISQEHAARVFDRLYQVSEASEAGRKGLGLGLHISKELVQAHDGRIWLESEPGRGSTFFFTLPVSSPLARARSQSRS